VISENIVVNSYDTLVNPDDIDVIAHDIVGSLLNVVVISYDINDPTEKILLKTSSFL
jgi:hypothetical protein